MTPTQAMAWLVVLGAPNDEDHGLYARARRIAGTVYRVLFLIVLVWLIAR